MATPENNNANVSYYVNCTSPAVASNYKFSVVPVLPNQRGKRIKKQTRSIIFNVYRSVLTQNPKWSMNQVCAKTASLIGITPRTVWYIKAEYERNKTLISNQNRKKPKIVDEENRVRSRVFKHDDEFLSHIRYTMHEYFFRNERPSTLKLLEVLKRNKKFQMLRKSTLHRLVKEMGFQRRPGCSYLIDRDDVILGRRKYLRQISHYRENGRAIYYVGELCIKDDSATVNNESSASKESMLLIIHAGSADGFVEGALDAFQIVQEKPEWHEVIDSDRVEQWFTTKLFPNIAEHSVIVIEHIPRHNAKIESLPNESWKKAEIQEWLSSKSLMWSPDSLKAELLNLVNSVKERFDGYKIDRLAALHNHTVLRIPAYHSDLNPIQHAWSEMKKCLAAESESIGVKDIKMISCEIISAITEKQWKNYIELVKINEARMWKLDDVLEEWLDARNEPDDSASESE